MPTEKIFQTIDDIDWRLLRELSVDGKTTYSTLAKKLGVTSQTVSDRIEKLKQRDIIKRFTLDLNPEKLGFSIEFIAELDVNVGKMDRILNVLQGIDEIHVIKITTGVHDILCIGNASSIDNLHDIVEKKISLIEGVNKTYTSITLRKVKEDQVLSLRI